MTRKKTQKILKKSNYTISFRISKIYIYYGKKRLL